MLRIGDAVGTQHWVLRTREHWLRCDHVQTAYDADQLRVTLASTPAPRPVPDPTLDAARFRYGAALDACGRLWRSVPSSAAAPAGHVERLDLARPDGAPAIVRLGDGGLVEPGCPVPELALTDPRGLCIDGAGQLYIADSGVPWGATAPVAARVYIVDLRDGRSIGRLRPPTRLGRASRPWDLFADPSGRGAFLLDRGTRSVWRLRPDRAPLQLLGPGGEWEHDGQDSLVDPVALIVAPDGAVVVLDRAPTGPQLVWARRRDIRVTPLPMGPEDPHPLDATCLALDGDGDLVVGGSPEATLLRYHLDGTGCEFVRVELHYVGESQPWGFDGGAVLADADRDVLYTEPDGVAAPSSAFPNYSPQGTVTSFALDSGIRACVWHRVFIEACLPEHTALHVRTRTSETVDVPPGITAPGPEGMQPLRPPQGFSAADMRHVDGAPTYHPFDVASVPDWTPMPRLLRRPAGADRPLYQPSYPGGERYDLYEGLVFSPPGRYLWLELTLAGTDRLTPQVAGLRAYYPRPSYLKYLPEIYREDPRAAEFLDRLLSVFECVHSELDEVRDHLSALFEPRAVPPEALDWLAGWLGLVLDPRWPQDRRRELVASAARLYRSRGTRAGLAQFLALYLDLPFQLVEAFRTRQSAGVIVGIDPASGKPGQSVLDGALVLHAPNQLLGDTRAYAHRFTLFVAGLLSDEQRAVVSDIVELEKPAHTLAEICDVTETCVVGTRALVGISTLVGRAACLRPAVIGDAAAPGGGWPVGREVVLGGRAPGDRTPAVGTTNLGRNTVLS